ncbi:HIT-type Zinc finger family protein [Forsythia ovata]|uniref:HIT-type Zinc finger family protein n=1 Tax=Forsythia ovata TaxID=205694 RepID=A0ABD1UXU1_9LAMI
MLDILKRFHEEDETDSMDEDGSRISLDDLSAEEKKRFQRAVASGELSKLITPWDPWWLKPSAKSISLGRDGANCVQPLVKQEHALESAMVLLGVSSVLGRSGQPETVLEALLHCLERTSSTAYKHMGGLQYGLGLMNDRVIQAAKKELKLEKLQKSKNVEIKNKLKSNERKVYFIMCWIYEQPAEVWSSLAALVDAEKSSAMECAGSNRGTVIMDKVERTGKPSIKELPERENGNPGRKLVENYCLGYCGSCLTYLRELLLLRNPRLA